MRVLVTGAAGFIGSHLSEALIAEGHAVVGLDCFTDYYDRSSKEANLASLGSDARFTLVEADLRTDPLEPVLANVDAVVNEAATPGLTLSWEDFESYESCNFRAVHRLLKACQATGVERFVQASTSSVYGSEAVGEEDRPTRPISPYGVTKLAAEHLLRAYFETFDFPVLILRYFSIYGPRQRPDMAYRIFCERLLRGQPVTVFGDGQQTRGNTYVSDCVAATTRALTHGSPGDVINVGGGRSISLLDALHVLADALGVEPAIEFQPARAGDQRHTMADIGHARQVLGWQPEVDPEEGLRREAEWVRSIQRP